MTTGECECSNGGLFFLICKRTRGLRGGDISIMTMIERQKDKKTKRQKDKNDDRSHASVCYSLAIKTGQMIINYNRDQLS